MSVTPWSHGYRFSPLDPHRAPVGEPPRDSWSTRIFRALTGDPRPVERVQTASSRVELPDPEALESVLLRVVGEWVSHLEVTELQLTQTSIDREHSEGSSDAAALMAVQEAEVALNGPLTEGLGVQWAEARALLAASFRGSGLTVNLLAPERILIMPNDMGDVEVYTTESFDAHLADAEQAGITVVQHPPGEAPQARAWQVADDDFWQAAVDALQAGFAYERCYPLAVLRVRNAETWHAIRSAADLAEVRAGLLPRDLVSVLTASLDDARATQAGVDAEIAAVLDDDGLVYAVLEDHHGAIRSFAFRYENNSADFVEARRFARSIRLYPSTGNDAYAATALNAVVADADGVVRVGWV